LLAAVAWHVPISGTDGIVYILKHDQGRYQTVRIDHDEESQHRPCDLTPWGPAPGEALMPEGKPVWN
jgi:hypothetical protein